MTKLRKGMVLKPKQGLNVCWQDRRGVANQGTIGPEQEIQVLGFDSISVAVCVSGYVYTGSTPEILANCRVIRRPRRKR